MSQAIGILDLTFKAGEDLTDKKHRFAKLDEDGKVVVSTSEKSVSIGILQNEPDTIDKAARVRMEGISKLVAGAAFSIGGILGGLVGGIEGTLITSDTDGRGIAANVNEYIGAIALEAAADAVELVEVLITHMYAPGSV